MYLYNNLFVSVNKPIVSVNKPIVLRQIVYNKFFGKDIVNINNNNNNNSKKYLFVINLLLNLQIILKI